MAEYRPGFRIVPDGPLSFAVQVLFPSARVEAVRGFPTEAEAAAWIIEQQKAADEPDPPA